MTGTGISMAAVLFTDLVGSTAHRARLGEELADELRRRHDGLLSDAVARHRGRVVKGVGDGILATFESTVDALSAAVAIQQAAADNASRHRGHAFEVRIGISVGDISFEDADVFGTAVIEASRLCGVAAGGQILVSELVQAVARGRGGHTFTSVGELELKGLPEPVRTLEVAWNPVTASSKRLPPAVAVLGVLPLSGRALMLDGLVQRWKASQAGEPGIVLLAGLPGAGKTRLAGELAHVVHAEGASVLYGHSEESLDTPFLAITEALRFHLGANPSASATELFGSAAGRLARLLPELLEREPSLETAAPEDPETDRYRTLTGICEVLDHVAGDDGLLLILDDLHWADRASVQMVRMLARSGVPSGVLVLGTYRDTEMDLTGPFGQAVAELPREATVTRVPVEGLDHEGVRALLDGAAGDDSYIPEEVEQLAGLLLAETDGNAFFLNALLVHLLESGAIALKDGMWRLTRSIEDVGIPQDVRDLLSKRLSLLPDGVTETLSTAAVIGPVFDIDLLAAVVRTELDDVVDHLDAALNAFLIDEEGVGRYRFFHALVRNALYDRLSVTRRTRAHQHIAEHLEDARPAEVDALAHHWAMTADASPAAAAKAIDFAVRAARRSMEQDAPDAAIDGFERALRLAEEHTHGDGAWRAEVLTELAIAERLAGKGSSERLEEAAREALRADRVDLAARAMVSDRGTVATAMSDIPPERRALQDEIVARSEGLPVPLRARMLGQRALDAVLCRDIGYRDAVVDAAWAAMDVLASPDDAEAIALTGAAVAAGAESSLRIELVVEARRRIAEVAHVLTGRTRAMTGLGSMGSAQIGMSLAEAEHHLAAALEIGDRLREPFARALTHWQRAYFEIARGDLVGAEAALERFTAVAALAEDPDLPLFPLAAEAVMSIQRGTLAEHVDLALLAAETYPEITAWKGYAAATLAMAGRQDEAVGWLDRVAEVDFEAEHPDSYYTALLAASTVAAAQIETPHRARIAELLDRVPFALCFAGMPVDPPQYFSGLLHRAMGNLDGAIERFRMATDRMEEMGARGFEARAKAQLGAVLAERDRSGDADEARHLAADACATARELGTGDVLDVCGHLV